MAFDLHWGAYADWLIRVEGLNVVDALSKVSKLYSKQYGKPFEVQQVNEILQFLEERF